MGGILLAPLQATFGPAGGEGGGFFGIVPFAGEGRALVEDHGNVGTEGGLDLHALFRGEESRRAIEVVLEVDPLLGDSACFGEGPDLKASRVGKQGTIPSAEGVESTEFTDGFLPGTEPEVVGITQNDFGVEKAQFIGMQGLDRTLGAHRHEDRGFDGAMRGGESTAAGLGGSIGSEKLEHWSGEKCLQLSRSRRETTYEKPFV